MYINDSAPFPLDLVNFDFHAKSSLPTFYRPSRTNVVQVMANNNDYKVSLPQQLHHQHQHQHHQHHQHHHHSSPDLNSYGHDVMQQQQVNGFSAPQSYPSESLQQHQHQHQHQQQLQQQLTPPTSAEPLQIISGNGDGQKGNRLRKACDSCSIRKVKCDESGPPCRACASLDIPCTFERPSRRRGPPNRHAEAIKRRRLEQENGYSSSPSSPNNVAATLASFSSHAVLNAESICPLSTLELLVDDFFTYIHPLVPFPHEPSFRAAFKHREDLSNPSFLALLASMVGTLVASFPRKPRLHLKAQHREKLFPNSISLVERCHKVAVEARGAGYLDKDLTVYDAATSYFLGLAAAYTFNWKQCRLYFAETLVIARSLGIHKNKDAGYYNNAGGLSANTGADEGGFGGKTPEAPDYIKQEIGRRVFWVTFVGVRSMQQMAANFAELTIPPPTRTEPYPPLPLEVDDEYIFVTHVDPQPAGLISRLAGFNLNIQIFTTCTSLNTMELAYGVDELFDWNRQKRCLEECLLNVKHILDLAPTELLLSADTSVPDFEVDRRQQYFPPTVDFASTRASRDGHPTESKEEQDRRYLQFEIQKANIFASQLATRSFIVEKYWNLYETYLRLKTSAASSAHSSPALSNSQLDSNGPTSTPGKQTPTSGQMDLMETQMSAERESIVKDLLRVLGSISQVNMEPNGGSFINKIRQIASTLLDTPRNRKSPLALRAEEYLGRFLDVLMKLERVSPGRGGGGGGDEWEDEEEELRNWADLREFQTRFLTTGGFDG